MPQLSLSAPGIPLMGEQQVTFWGDSPCKSLWPMSHWLTWSDGTLLLCILLWRGDTPAGSRLCYLEPGKHLRNSFLETSMKGIWHYVRLHAHPLLLFFKEKFFISESWWKQFPNVSEMAGKVIGLYEHIHIYNCGCITVGPKGNLETYPSSEASCIMQAPACFLILKEDVHLKKKKKKGSGFWWFGVFCPTTLTVQICSNSQLAK